MESDWPDGKPRPHPTKSCSLKCYHPFMIITTQKIKDITKRPHTQKAIHSHKKKKKKKEFSGTTLAWWPSPCKKQTKITWFFQHILIIKESCNLTRWEAQVATIKQNRQSHMLPSLDGYLHAKHLRVPLIPSRDINNQKILQSNWMRGTTSHTQSKEVAPDATFT